MPGHFSTDPLDDEIDPFTAGEATLLAAIVVIAICLLALLVLGLWTATKMAGRLLP